MSDILIGNKLFCIIQMSYQINKNKKKKQNKICIITDNITIFKLIITSENKHLRNSWYLSNSYKHVRGFTSDFNNSNFELWNIVNFV